MWAWTAVRFLTSPGDNLPEKKVNPLDSKEDWEGETYWCYLSLFWSQHQSLHHRFSFLLALVRVRFLTLATQKYWLIQHPYHSFQKITPDPIPHFLQSLSVSSCTSSCFLLTDSSSSVWSRLQFLLILKKKKKSKSKNKQTTSHDPVQSSTYSPLSLWILIPFSLWKSPV